MTRREDDPPEVYRITGAPASRTEDHDKRVKRYIISMAIRTACVVLVFVVPGPARWIFAIGAVFLPYVAVLFANAGGARRGPAPARVDHRGLTSGGAPQDAPHDSAPGTRHSA